MQKEKTIQFWNDYYRNEESKRDSFTTNNQPQEQQREEITLQNNNKEWIVQPTIKLLDTIHSHCNVFFQTDPQQQQQQPTKTQSPNVVSMLEIGCGTTLITCGH